MGTLSHIFSIISTSLMIPVMLGLLICLLRAMIVAGQTLREHMVRRGTEEALAEYSTALETEDAALPELKGQGLVTATLRSLADLTSRDEVLVEQRLQKTELVWQSELEKLRVLMRFGPALGLMGTLIPLGPALVGLAAGNLEMMSSNLVIAFATTVVGLLISTLSLGLLSLKKAWYQKDSLLISFAATRLAERQAAGLRAVQDKGLLAAAASAGGACTQGDDS